MIDIYSKPQIVGAFRAHAVELPEFLGTVPADVFAQGSTEQWGPAHHVEHLISVATRVGAAVSNKSALPPREPARSRDFATVRDLYLATLAQVPAETLKSFGARVQVAPSEQETLLRTQSSARLAAALTALSDAVDGWSDDELDAYGMPHPILGVLSVREMLLFTLYHNTHHQRGIARLLSSAA
jgi:hypothetical protein